MFNKLARRVIFSLGVIALLLRFAAIANIPLLSEEAYYWMFSRHLAMSYFDHPPMVAWIIRAGTWVFGNTELGVRVVACLMMCISSVFMFLMARIWFGRDTALVAAASLQILPLYFAMGCSGMTDAPLLFFWLASLWMISIALFRPMIWPWCLAGLACGCAMLSKYTAVFIPIGVVLVLVLHQPYRKYLRSPGPYLAFLIALACFFPVILWNAQNHWASFRFQLFNRFNRASFGWRYIGRFIFYQIVIITPFFFLALPRMILRSWRRRPHPRWIFTWAFSLPLLALMASRCLRYEVHINWTLPAFLTLIPAAIYLLRIQIHRTPDWKAPGAWANGCFIGCLAINLCVMLYFLAGANCDLTLPGIAPWPKLARFVETYEDQLEDETQREPMVIVDGTYRLASIIAFYRDPMEPNARSSDYTTSDWFIKGEGLEYEFWTKRDAWRGRNCIFITDDPVFVGRLKRYFASVTVPTSFLTLDGESYHIALCRDFHPQEKSP